MPKLDRSDSSSACGTPSSVRNSCSDLRTVWCGVPWMSLAMAVILAFMPMRVDGSDIYLEQGVGGTPWDGNCDVTSCNSTTSCTLLGMTLVRPSTSRCRIIFGVGSYRNATINFTGDWRFIGLRLEFPSGVVSDLVVLDHFSSANGYVKLIGNSSSTSTLSHVSIDVRSFDAMEVARVSMVDGLVSFRRHNTSNPIDFLSRLYDSQFDASTVSLEASYIDLGNVTSTPSCNLTLTSNCPDELRGDCIIGISNSRLHELRHPLLFLAGSLHYMGRFDCRNSLITTHAPTLTEQRFLDYANSSQHWDFLTDSNQCNISGLRPSTSSITSLVSYPNAPSSLGMGFYRSTFNNIFINQPLVIWYSIMENVDFIDCPMDLNLTAEYSYFLWTNVTMIQRNPNLPVILRTYDNRTQSLTNVTFSNPNRLPGNRFSFVARSLANFSSSSLLNISNLHLDTPSLHISSIEVTQSISTSITQSTISAAPEFSPQTWTFHSINVTDVILSPPDNLTLVYVPSEPKKGIKLVGSSRFTKQPNCSVHWHSGLPPPKNLGVYPLVVLPGEHAIGDKFDLLQQPGSGWIFEGIFASPPLLSFVALSNKSRTPCPVVVPDGFQCSADGAIYAGESFSSPSFDVPSSYGNVLILGNLTVGSSIAFTGTGSNLVVTGCVEAESVVLDLSKDTGTYQGPVTLITQSSSCMSSLNDVTLNVKLPPKKGCKRTTFERQRSGNERAQLVLVFRIDESGCNTKWIIVGAVVGGVLLILMILALIATLNPTTRSHIPCLPKPMKNE